MLQIEVEEFEHALPGIVSLAGEHAREIMNEELSAQCPDIVIDPDWGTMLALARGGLFLCITVRDPEIELEPGLGMLVGYAQFMIFPDMHRKLKDGAYLLSAADDAYFVLPSYRGARVGLRLFETSIAALEARGVRKISVHTKAFKRDARLLNALGFVRDDIVWVRYSEALPSATADALAAE